MRLILFMASDAIARCVPELRLGCVARGAGQGRMRSLQREIGICVVEGFRIELHDIRVATVMVGVAVPAFLLQNLLSAAVKAATIGDVLIDLLVAIEA